MIVGGGICERPGAQHAGDDLPVGFRRDIYRRREIGAQAFRVKKEIRSIEEEEVRPAPARPVVESVRPPEREPPHVSGLDPHRGPRDLAVEPTKRAAAVPGLQHLPPPDGVTAS